MFAEKARAKQKIKLKKESALKPPCKLCPIAADPEKTGDLSQFTTRGRLAVFHHKSNFFPFLGGQGVGARTVSLYLLSRAVLLLQKDNSAKSHTFLASSWVIKTPTLSRHNLNLVMQNLQCNIDQPFRLHPEVMPCPSPQLPVDCLVPEASMHLTFLSIPWAAAPTNS